MKKHVLFLTLLLAVPALAEPFHSSEVKEEKAELLSDSYSMETGERTLLHGWQVKDAHVDEATAYLKDHASTKNVGNSRYVTKPQGADGTQEFSGTYILGRVYFDAQSGFVVRSLHSVATISSVATLAAASYVETRDNEILSLFDFQTGEGDAYAIVWRGLHPTSETYLTTTLADASIVSEFASTYTYAGRHWEINPDSGAGVFSVLLRYVTWRSWSTNLEPDIVEYSSADSDRESISRTWVGLSNTNEQTVASDLRSGNGNAAPPSGYYVSAVGVSRRDNGAMDASQSVRKQLSNSVVTADQLLDPDSLCSGLRTETTITYSGYKSTNDVPNPAAYAVSLTNSVIRNALTGPDGDGRYGREIVLRSSTWGAWSNETANSYDFIGYSNKDDASEERRKVWCAIQNTDMAEAIAALWGESFTDDGFAVIDVPPARDNGDGSITLSQVQVKTGWTNAARSVSYSTFSQQNSSTDRRMTNAVTHEVSVADGVITSTSHREGDGGLYDNTTETRTAVEASLGTNTAFDAFQTNTSERVVNTTNTVSSSLDTNVIVEGQNTLNEYGRYDTVSSRTDFVPVSDVEVRTTVDAFGTSTVSRAVNQTSPEATPTNLTIGTLKTVENTKTKANAYNTSVSQQVAVRGAEAGTNTAATIFRSDVGGTTRGNTNAPAAGGVSGDTLTQYRGTRERDGTWTTTQSSTTFSNVEDVVRSSAADYFSETLSVTTNHEDDATGDSTNVTNGVIQSFSSRKDPTGKYDNTVTTDEGVARNWSSTVQESEFGSVTRNTYRNQTNAIAIPTVAGTTTGVARAYSYNRYGLIDYADTISATTDKSTLGSSGTYQWYSKGPGTFWVVVTAEVEGRTIVTDQTRYWRTYVNTVTLFNSLEDAWDYRDEQATVDSSDLSPRIGTFAPGIYYYYTRGVTNLNALAGF